MKDEPSNLPGPTSLHLLDRQLRLSADQSDISQGLWQADVLWFRQAITDEEIGFRPLQYKGALPVPMPSCLCRRGRLIERPQPKHWRVVTFARNVIGGGLYSRISRELATPRWCFPFPARRCEVHIAFAGSSRTPRLFRRNAQVARRCLR